MKFFETCILTAFIAELLLSATFAIMLWERLS